MGRSDVNSPFAEKHQEAVHGELVLYYQKSRGFLVAIFFRRSGREFDFSSRPYVGWGHSEHVENAVSLGLIRQDKY